MCTVSLCDIVSLGIVYYVVVTFSVYFIFSRLVRYGVLNVRRARGVLSRHVVEKGSVSVGGVFKCSFCPCVFGSQVDLDSHLAVFGRHGHVWEFRKLHSSGVKRVVFGYCSCGVESGHKPKKVYEAIDSFILCPSCRHFRARSVE